MIRRELFATDSETPMRPNGATRELLSKLSVHAKRAGGLSSNPYNLTISHSFRFVWFRVAKVGTRTIIDHLKSSGITLDVEHAMGIQYPRAMFDNYFKFAFVRDPFDRLVSCWRNKVLDENHFGLSESQRDDFQDFGQFLNWVELQDLDRGDHHLRKQQRLVDLNHVDFIGRMESFEHDFIRVCETLGISWRVVPKRNVSITVNDNAALRQENIDRVVRLYEIDFQLFGYQP